MTQTAAYNANEVAAVYMSLNRDDLLSVEEGGQRLGKDASLQNGFYGLSDPLNLRGVLESFEADFTQGNKSCSYKVRILNPTTELENILIGFYSRIFPQNSSVFNTFEDATERQKRMNRAYEITGDQTSAFATSGANAVKAQFPIIYLRFGYGTNADEGLSRIHKAQVFDIKYIIQENKDKMIELNAVDQFTFTNQNPSFNKRPFASRVKVSKENEDGSFSLKLPSEILSNVLTDYMTVFQPCVPYVNIGGYKEDIDNLVFSLAAAQAEKDEIARQTALIKEQSFMGLGIGVDVPEPEPAELTQKEINQIKDLLDRPLITTETIDRGSRGVITPQILFNAYKQVFNQLGMKWEMSPIDTPEPVTGPTAAEQLTPFNTPVGGSAAKNAQGKVLQSLKELDDQVVNLKTELLHAPPLTGNINTLLENSPIGKTNRLSFWPMALVDVPRSTDFEFDAGQLLGTITKIETYGELTITNKWAGVAPTDCETKVDGPPITLGCGTGPEPPPPTKPTSTRKGVVVHFAESAETIRANTKPLTRSYYNNTAERRNNQQSTTPVNDSYDVESDTYFPPQWYAYGSADPTEQNNDPIKVKIVNVEGTVELNNADYYLYQADSDGSNGSKFFLTRALPDGGNLDGSVDADWVNKFNTENLSPYEKGGSIILADAPLRAPQPEGVQREIRPLTVKEKKNLQAAGWGPIWLDAGYINLDNYEVRKNINDDFNYKYSFSVGQLKKTINASNLISAQREFNGLSPRGNPELRPLDVNVPVTLASSLINPGEGTNIPVQNLWFKPFVGPRTNPITMNPTEIGLGTTGLSGTAPITPLWDLQTQQYFDAVKFQELPDGEFKQWANYAVGACIAAKQAVVQDNIDAMIAADRELAVNPIPLRLEPTIETAYFIGSVASNFQAVQQGIDEAAEEEQQKLEKAALEKENKQKSPEQIKKDAFIRKINKFNNAFVTMSDDGANPHISSFLETMLNNINRMVVGKTSKMRVQQLQVNMLSPEEKKILKENCPGLEGVNWESDDFAKKDKTILILAPGDTIEEDWTKRIIRPVKSFPQTFDPSAGNAVIYLDYGTANSIVAKVDFTGDNRVLVNLAQSHYSVRQFNDIKSLFDGMQTFSSDMITNAISNILADKIKQLEDKKINSATVQQDESQLAKLRQQREEFINTTTVEGGQVSNGETTAFINDDILKMLPTLIDSYDDPKDLANVLGKKTAEDILKLASVIDDPTLVNLIFPEADIDGKNNETTTEVFEIGDTRPRKEVKNKVLRRRVDFDSIRARISEKDRVDKMQDIKFNFNKAMGQEVFNITLTTLGIPEIDEPGSEFLTRRIFFKFYDPRLASGELHWLSGAYQIIGFKHRINPSQGFLTELSLVRDIKVNINEVRDYR